VFGAITKALGTISFSPTYGQTIAVDIPYVLFVNENFGGAGRILNGANISAGNSKARAAAN
jgi:hypothetical protein